MSDENKEQQENKEDVVELDNEITTENDGIKISNDGDTLVCWLDFMGVLQELLFQKFQEFQEWQEDLPEDFQKYLVERKI